MILFVYFFYSWDRWVLSESVLKDCDASRQLQKKLYEQAVGYVCAYFNQDMLHFMD